MDEQAERIRASHAEPAPKHGRQTGHDAIAVALSYRPDVMTRESLTSVVWDIN